MIEDFPLGTYYLSAGRPASGLVTINFAPAIGDTVTVDGTVYTFGTDFFGPTPAIAAESLAGAMSGNWRVRLSSHPTTLVRSHYGRALGNFVVVIATVPGTGGNSLALAVSNSTRFTVSGATLAGGTSPAAASSVAVTDIEDGAGDSVMDAVNDAIRVNVVAGAAGGTQYTEADVDASITGNALMLEGAANTLVAATGDVANGLDVDVTRSALPSGASTSAKQDTIIGHLDGVEALLTTIDGDTGTLAGAVAGTEMQVDIVSMPAVDTELTTADVDTGAGTDTRAVVGIVGTASGGGQLIPGSSTDGLLVNLGTNNDVTVTGTVTANLSATDNAVLDAIEADTTILAGAVSGTEMQVDVLTSALPTGAATLAEQQTQTTHLATIAGDTTDIETAVELIDDSVATLGTTTYLEATTKGLIVSAVRRDADTSAVNTDNETAPLVVDARGALKVEAFSGETLPVSLASVPSHAVTNAGTFAVQVDGSALTSLQLIDDVVFTDDNAFTPGTSKLAVIGAQADDTSPDSVDEGDAGALRMSLTRMLLVQPRSTGLTLVTVSGTTSSSGDTTLVSADASNKIRVVAFSLTSTSTTSNTIKFTDGAGGTELWRVIVQAISGGSFGANLAVGAPAYIFGNAAVNTALVLNLSAASAVHYSISYFKEP